MNKLYKGLSALLIALALLQGSVTFANKTPKRFLRNTKKASRLAELTTKQQIRSAAKISTNINITVTTAVKVAPKAVPLPWKPLPKISSVIHDEKDIFKALKKTWQFQDQYGNHNLIKTFLQVYYKQHFQTVTPHLENLFDTISKLNNRDLERKLIKRMNFLIKNKELLIAEINSEIDPTSVRLRYLANVEVLTAENFREDQLVLSLERYMSPHPQKDFPVRHVNGQSVLTVGQGSYQIYKYEGPFDYLPNLYRYLINGNQTKAPFTIVFDEEGKSLAVFNQNKTLWLRITPHEYSSPYQLHIHLNELRTVTLVSTYGSETEEKININLSIPLLTPNNLPSYNVSDFLYTQLIENPVKSLSGNVHVTILKKPIF